VTNVSRTITEHKEKSHYPGGSKVFLGTSSVTIDVSVLLGCGMIQPLMMRPTFCLETTSANNPGTWCHIPEEWRSQDPKVVLMGI
jgi:hypothetical protein